MDTRQLQNCSAIIKKNKIEIIDLKCIDLTGYFHHISLSKKVSTFLPSPLS